MKLLNVRREGNTVSADFVAPDGRMGSVSCPATEYRDLDEQTLLQEAAWVVRELRRRDEYVPPDRDRFNELG